MLLLDAIHLYSWRHKKIVVSITTPLSLRLIPHLKTLCLVTIGWSQLTRTRVGSFIMTDEKVIPPCTFMHNVTYMTYVTGNESRPRISYIIKQFTYSKIVPQWKETRDIYGNSSYTIDDASCCWFNLKAIRKYTETNVTMIYVKCDRKYHNMIAREIHQRKIAFARSEREKPAIEIVANLNCLSARWKQWSIAFIFLKKITLHFSSA